MAKPRSLKRAIQVNLAQYLLWCACGIALVTIGAVRISQGHFGAGEIAGMACGAIGATAGVLNAVKGCKALRVYRRIPGRSTVHIQRSQP